MPPAIVFLRPLHQRYSIDAISDFPGKVHAAPTPRIGGYAHATNIVDGLNANTRGRYANPAGNIVNA